jgi:hypothetical protein
MKSSNEWLKRKRRYERNNNIVCKIFMKLYYRFEELIWLGICVGICVIVFKFVFFLGF